MSARLDRSQPAAPASETAGGGISRRVTAPDPRLKIPAVDAGLIIYLRSVFPASVSRDKDLRTYDAEAGQQEVITHLEMLWAEQNPKG